MFGRFRRLVVCDLLIVCLCVQDVLENETRPGMIGASFKSFAELMEAIRINQEDIESLLRDTRKKSQV